MTCSCRETGRREGEEQREGVIIVCCDYEPTCYAEVMVATVRCDEIANERFGCLTSDAEWLDLENDVQAGSVLSFGKKLGSIVEVHMEEYDKEAVYFDEAVRKSKRQLLESRILNLVQPAFQKNLSHLRTKALEKFKTGLNQSLESGKGFAASVRETTESSLSEFNQGCAGVRLGSYNPSPDPTLCGSFYALGLSYLLHVPADWDYSKTLEKVRRDIEDHALSVRESKLTELTNHAKEKLRKALVEPVESLFDAAGQTTWASIESLYKRETQAILPEVFKALSGFEMGSEFSEEMVSKLRDYGQSIVENKAKEEASKILMHMKERFTVVFSHDKDSMPRTWTGKEDVRAIAKEARSAALKLLSVLAVIRWDDKPDRIENILISTLLDGSVASKSSSASSGDPLASTSWEEQKVELLIPRIHHFTKQLKQVHPKHTLITPAQCKSVWKQFQSETEFTITQAVSTQQAHRRGNGRLPPPWALVAMAVLGFDEIMMLLRNPIYVFLLFVGYLLVRALAVQLDIGREFQNGMVPGILSVSAKLLPTLQNLLNKVATDQQQPQQQGQQHRPPAAEAPEAQHPPPPLLLSPKSSMSELRRLHTPPSPVRRSVSSPSHSSPPSPKASPRKVAEEQKPPDNESSSAYSIV
ncbi:Protein ROOT HAIR DEFECTIVE 3-like protein 1 [Triticum urartu]|uniref:Protein ROOT HAIR DEFECTIVE 3-like protein 1 n=1 Tax=Triticum urartu TaxID=4572 RepID=M7YJR2_TRIUA|nr:Protein ROOT HAIR DEFECTIVE 3-like protein 1 [Triticum urartu]